MFACSSARNTPTCPRAFAPPPDKTSTVLLTSALVVAPLHHAVGATLGGALVAAFLIGCLGNDWGYFRRPAVFIERHVGDVARIRVAPLTGQHFFREHLHADLHRCPARKVNPRHRRD